MRFPYGWSGGKHDGGTTLFIEPDKDDIWGGGSGGIRPERSGTQTI